jgi:hypothetical protein
MPTEQIIVLLIQEREKLNRAIEALQGPTKHRGRPPMRVGVSSDGASAPITASPEPVRRKRTLTAAQRQQQGERMKAFWAARREAKANATATRETIRKKRTFTAAQKKQQGERMKAYWEAKRKNESKPVAKKRAAKTA